MTHLEMRNFDLHYDPEDTEMSAQERLLFNNNYHGPQNGGLGSSSQEDENQYQVPYGHLQQAHFLQHQAQVQQQHQQHQQHPELSYSGSSNGDQTGTFRSVTPQLNGHYTHAHPGMTTLPPHHSPCPPSSPYLGGHQHPHQGFQDKYSVAYPLRNEHGGHPGLRNTGSGIVYRPRRKLWWVAAMLMLFLLLIAGAVVIALYFTVLRKDLEAPQSAGGNDESRGTDETGTNAVGTPVGTAPDDDYRYPHVPPNQGNGEPEIPYLYPDLDPPTTRQPWVNQVQKFEAFWHPGDSRLFSAALNNGTTVRAFGPKKSNGEVKSLYSLSLTADDGSVSSVRFLGQNNLASVILPSGVIVNYDLTTKDQHMEIKVFEPYITGRQGPISHLALVEVGIGAYFFRQVPKIMRELPRYKNGQGPSTGGRPGSTKCFARFPVKVTKCGGKYPYGGAFVQGEITGLNQPIHMAALPWPKEPDPCYSHSSNMVSNFYLPLPSHIDDENATIIKAAYTASSARMFHQLCLITNRQTYDERQALCDVIANRVEKKLNNKQIFTIIHNSCTAIVKSIHVACVAISDISALDKMPSITENSLLRSLSRRLSDSFQPGLPDKVDLKAHAFCPSSLPQSSYETTVDINAIHGNVVQDAIHINCHDYPEVTKVDLDHLLTKSSMSSSDSHFDLVKHKMRVCSLCAFEKTVTAEIIKDEMICNNTCSKNTMELVSDYYVEEKKEFTNQDSVYCHDFLTTVDNRMEPIGHKCRANCMSHLDVRLKILDPTSQITYYDQTIQCSELRGHFCRTTYGR